MKAVCLAFLLVLSLQLQIDSHLVSSPLEGTTYEVIDSKDHHSGLVGIKVSFTATEVSFQGCNHNKANYTITDKTIKFTRWVSTRVHCFEKDYDHVLRPLFTEATSYKLDDRTLELVLLNKKGENVLTLAAEE